jgi:hypothetical protein
MIVVPRVSGPDIAPEAMPSARIGNQVSAGGMGADIGQGLQQLGQAADELYQREQYKANAAAGSQQVLDLSTKEASLRDPNNPQGIYSYKGIDAQKVPGVVRQQMQEFYNEYQQKLTNPVQKEMFSRLYSRRMLAISDEANRYAVGQTEGYQRQVYTGGLGTTLSSATSKAQAGDTFGAQQAEQEGISLIQQYGHANGWAPEYTQSSVDKFQKSIQAANQSATRAQVEQSILQNPQGTLNDLGARLGVNQYSPANQAISGQPGAARGVQNNNPGNLQQSPVAWQGKVSSSDPRFEAFASPQLGIRALGVNALHLQAGGANSVSDLVAQWSPASENGQANTAAYIAAVAKTMGVDPNANVDLRNPATLTAFTNAIITHENKGNPYSPDVVQAGVSAALGQSKLADAHPAVTTNGSGLIVPGDGTGTPIAELKRTGNAQIDSLPTADVVQLYNRAREEVNRGKVNQRAGIEQRVRDDTAAFQNGQTVKQPLSLGDFTQAYGDQQGMTAFGAYQSNQQLGQDLQTVSTLTPTQMQALAQARQPTPGENFAVKQEDENHLERAMHQTLTLRAKDPVAWAMQANVGGVQALDTSSPDKLGASLASRASAMDALSSTYQMPNRMLSEPERAQLAATLQNAPVGTKAQMLGAITSKLPEQDADRVLQSITPDAPVMGYAGRIMAAERSAQTGTTGSLWWKQPSMMSASDVAQTMIDGQQLLNPVAAPDPETGKAPKAHGAKPKFAMPADGGISGLRSEWTAVAGDAFRGDGAGDAQAYQAFRAMYAGLAAKQGISDGSLNANLATEAARATLGNVTDWNGHQVIPPYGMDGNVFKDAVNASWQAQRANVPGAESQDAGAYTLDTLAPGTYGMSNGGAPVLDQHGRPMVLRINAANAAQIHAQAQQLASKPPAPSAPTAALDLPRMSISE